MTSTRVRVMKTDNGYVGSITLGCPDCGGVGDSGGDGIITVGAIGDTQADALHKAALIAERITDDPIIQAILPPQAKAAIVATKKLASAAKRGSRFFRRMWRKYNGPGIHRLAKALHDEAMKQEGHTDATVAGFWSSVKNAAKKAARYGTVPGLIYTAAQRMRRKKRKRPIPPPQATEHEHSEDDELPEDDAQQDAPAPAPEPMPEQDSDDNADNGEDGDDE